MRLDDYQNEYDGDYGYFDNKVTSYKPNSRKRPQADIGGLIGWFEIFMLMTEGRRARKEAKRQAKQPYVEPASAKFTPHEEKKKKVRFTVVDD